MDPSTAARLRAVLVGVDLPADRAALLEQAVRSHAESALIGELRALPERTFASLDDVAEALLRVRPDGRISPGGDGYTS